MILSELISLVTIVVCKRDSSFHEILMLKKILSSAIALETISLASLRPPLDLCYSTPLRNRSVHHHIPA